MDKIFFLKNQLFLILLKSVNYFVHDIVIFSHKILRMQPVVDLGGARGPPPLSEPNFFHFHAVLGGNWLNNRLASPLSVTGNILSSFTVKINTV